MGNKKYYKIFLKFLCFYQNSCAFIEIFGTKWANGKRLHIGSFDRLIKSLFHTFVCILINLIRSVGCFLFISLWGVVEHFSVLSIESAVMRKPLFWVSDGPGLTQTGLCGHRRWLEAWNFSIWEVLRIVLSLS